MTPEKAIEELSSDLKTIEEMMAYIRDFENGNDLSLAYKTNRMEALEVAIFALKEIQQYRQIGTVEEFREAVGKQKPKIIKEREWNPSFCPTCKYELSHHVGDGFYKHPTFLTRCPRCGQAIKFD